MSKLPPLPPPPPSFGRRLARFALIGAGALAVMSAVVNIVAAWQLIDLAEEQSLGITRQEFISGYLVMAAIGLALIYAGVRRWR